MESIITAIISGGLALVGVIITNTAQSRKIEQKLEVAQAVTDTKLEALTHEVRAHNNFAERIPVLEEQAKATNRRLKNLEGGNSHEDKL